MPARQRPSARGEKSGGVGHAKGESCADAHDRGPGAQRVRDTVIRLQIPYAEQCGMLKSKVVGRRWGIPSAKPGSPIFARRSRRNCSGPMYQE